MGLFSKKRKISRQDALRATAFRSAINKSKHKKRIDALTHPYQAFRRQIKRLWKYFGRHRHELRGPILLVLWVGWLIIGTFFYAYAPKSNLGFIRGFFMSLNIGYSIGFGYPSEESNNYLWFSIWYVLCGASFVGVALGFFADNIAKDNETWFTRMEQQRKIEAAIRKRETYYMGKLRAGIYHCKHAIRALAVWATFVLSMVIYSSIQMKWPLRESLYFAISSLSTGGHWQIPEWAPDWMFGVTGVHIMFGVPVMGVAMAQTAMLFIEHVGIDEAKASIDEVVTRDEIVFLQELGFENFDGEIDRAEFIILCMVRLGTDPGLIKYITGRYSELSFFSGRALTVSEITHGSCRWVDGRVRRRESLAPLSSTLHTVTEHEIVVADDNAFVDFFHEDSSDDEESFAEYRLSYQSYRKSFLPSSIREADEEDSDNNDDEDGNPTYDEEAPEVFLNEDVASDSGNDEAQDLRKSTGTTSSEISFLRSVIERFGLPLVSSTRSSVTKKTDSTSSSTALNDNMVDEPPSQNVASIQNPIQKFVNDLREECAPAESHHNSGKESCPIPHDNTANTETRPSKSPHNNSPAVSDPASRVPQKDTQVQSHNNRIPVESTTSINFPPEKGTTPSVTITIKSRTVRDEEKRGKSLFSNEHTNQTRTENAGMGFVMVPMKGPLKAKSPPSPPIHQSPKSTSPPPLDGVRIRSAPPPDEQDPGEQDKRHRNGVNYASFLYSATQHPRQDSAVRATTNINQTEYDAEANGRTID